MNKTSKPRFRYRIQNFNGSSVELSADKIDICGDFVVFFIGNNTFIEMHHKSEVKQVTVIGVNDEQEEQTAS